MDKNKFLGIVLYTDGSARPNPGFTGWGAHGYFYEALPESKKHIIATKHFIPTKYGYIHQSGLGQNPRAIPIEPVYYIEGFGSNTQTSTNNNAELSSLLESLKMLKDYEFEEVQIFTDSEYLRKGLTEWRSVWERTNYVTSQNQPVSNKEKWIELFSLYDALIAKNINFEIDWVKGHADSFGNIIADKLAAIGMLYSASNEEISKFDIEPAKGYWKIDIDRHPFIGFNRIYFNSQLKYNIFGQYFLAEPGKDELVIGKRIPETSYSIVRLNEPDPLIEKIRSRQFKVAQDINSIVCMKLDRVYNPDTFKYINEHADKVLVTNYRNKISLDFINRDYPITVEYNPAGLSLRTLEAISFLEEILERYIDVKESRENTSGKKVEIFDITNQIFDDIPANGKKPATKKIKNEHGVGSVYFKVDVELTKEADAKEVTKISIPIIFGADTLHRNSLKKIENSNPKVSLVIWYESDTCVRYATVCEIDGGIGIWSNFYADRIFI